MKKVIFYMAYFFMAWSISMLLFSFLTVIIKVVVSLVYLQGVIKVGYSFDEFYLNVKISAFCGVMSVIASFLYKQYGGRR
ncbi:hypothetical protein [Aeromonas sp. MR7]|uniref:hypothetical protein n=1 Tax=Aeromonas sp. MR7 TaxID=2923419 RepID=UPI001F4AAAED|nr:hypothetical protein [Aeromonas sp. MR7]MCH7347725.1 hypothetical protein [Aeromonas sp. MR7]